MAHTVREATYEFLRTLDLNIIFGNPGSSELPFLRDMPQDFRYVLGLHERSAAGMALGYAVGTRKAAFVNLQISNPAIAGTVLDVDAGDGLGTWPGESE